MSPSERDEEVCVTVVLAIHALRTVRFLLLQLTTLISVGAANLVPFLSFIATLYCSAPMFLRQFVVGAL